MLQIPITTVTGLKAQYLIAEVSDPISLTNYRRKDLQEDHVSKVK